MFTIIPASSFIITSWKNGLGETTELAINDGGTLADFDWRLSMASVKQDGEFSNFAGYQRNLILIKGNGITLTCNNQLECFTYQLTNLLDIAHFDGGDNTLGELIDGEIIDFNIMTRQGKVSANVATFAGSQSFTTKPKMLTFVYSLTGDIHIEEQKDDNQTVNEQITVPHGDLLRIAPENTQMLSLSGQDLIIIEFISL